MSPFKSILAATDFSVSANNAVHRAAWLASAHGARLRIVHVLARPKGRWRHGLSPEPDFDRRVSEAHAELRRLATALSAQHRVTPALEVLSGDTVEAVNQALVDADLLVIGHRRKHPLARLVLGQAEQRLVAHSRRPVLVVKRSACSGYRRVLMPTDFTPAADAAAAVAATLASGLDLQLFHAFDSPGEIVLREADVSENIIRACRVHDESALIACMRRSMGRVGWDSDRLSFAFGRGSPVKAALRQADGFGADVIVAASHRRGRFAMAVLGGINRLLAGAACDLLIVPGWVRERRPGAATVPARPGVQATGIGAANTARAGPASGSSWMGTQLPAEAFMFAAQERPDRASR